VNEVAAQTGALLLDALDQRGLDPAVVWQGLPVTRELLRERGARLDWETWVAMCARAELHSPVPMDELFVAGAGARSGHPFAQIAGSLLSVRDLYAFFARWGIRRSFTNARGAFVMETPTRARFTMTIDAQHAGSTPSMKFLAGMLRLMTWMQGYPPTQVDATIDTTGHHAEYVIELPTERSFVARTRRVLRVFGGVNATLAELEAQANEIATKNAALEVQLAEARERDEWLEVAMSAGSVGVWRWDPSTRRVRISPILATWLDVPGQVEVDTTVWGQNVHPEDRPALIRTMSTAMETRRSYEAEYRIIRPNGDVMWLTVAGNFQMLPDGRIYAYGSAKDITEKKLLETQLRLADRLIAAGTLAAGVAHEINNPLTYVIGSLDLMQRRLGQYPVAREATQDLLAQVLDGCDRISAVVADIRTFARHDDNAVVPIDPRAVCAGALRIVSSDVRHRATVETEFADDTPYVMANDSRLGQVMINLIVNASQAMPAERASDLNRIVIRTRRAGSGEVAIEVEDNGTGIAPDVVPRVFDPFFTTKPIGVGTGLGLSVCQGIVTALGGRIDLASTEGRGSKFTVTLASGPHSHAAPTTTDAPRPSTTTSRVLVIDDEPMIRSVVARTLVAQGFAVDEAASGRDGLARAVGENRYDAILCDLMMPDLDGVALHHELASQRPELASRMVFISGGAVTARTQAFLQTPGVVVLHKPFAFERLVEAIERAART
jgi:signal transduction histidine kinase